MRIRRAVIGAAAAALTLLGTGLVPAAAETETASPAGPAPVVYDSDLDFDDASTLAYLCQEHKQGRIALRAVTVVNNGIGTTGRSLTHARTILEGCGLPDVPVADGNAEGVNPAPPEARELFERVLSGALGDGDVTDQPSPMPASELIAKTVRESPVPVTVLATGPLSNVADAVASPAVARGIGRLYVMGGVFDVSGNLFGSTTGGFDNTQEVNMWIDSAAADEVFASVPPTRVRIVPLDATNHVPITPAFVEKLGVEARTYEARLVHRILTQPDITPLIDLDIMFWWDALAAVSLTRDGGVVDYRLRLVDVVRGGPSDGRTVAVPGGTPQWVGYDADRLFFEQNFVDGLNGRSLGGGRAAASPGASLSLG